jgi:DNA repair protein RadA/Sms
MVRAQSRYVCQACGATTLRWEGQCRSCEAWNTLVETLVRPADERAARARAVAHAGAEPVSLSRADGVAEASRRPVGIGELDRVLGGGLVDGSVVLLGGEPGIGKSTLLLQAAAGIARASAGSGGVLYASGEESAGQIRLRAGRLGLLDDVAGAAIRVVAATDVGSITERARADRPALLVVDSVQTIGSDELDGAPGSVGQVREVTLRLMELAKGEGLPVVLVGHVTKDGTLAGPKTLEHLVDVVLTLDGDRTGSLRLLRAAKNRFGSTEEVGVFEMGESGLDELADPARAFLSQNDGPAPGIVVAQTLEGSRPLLVEVQSLVSSTVYPSPRRTTSGIDTDRLALLVAVLGRRAGIGLGSHDVYANLAGGLAVSEPGLDLPLAIALASSLRDRPVEPGTVAIGEVGLLGELRPVAGVERRLREAARLGFDQAIVPRATRGRELPSIPGLRLRPAASLREAIGHALGAPSDGERGRRPVEASAR